MGALKLDGSVARRCFVQRTLQCATAVAVRNSCQRVSPCGEFQHQIRHTSLLLAEALHTLRGRHDRDFMWEKDFGDVVGYRGVRSLESSAVWVR